jgi:hypothetical protein
MLLDRLPERAALSGLLDAARAGRSGVLVMRGEPGVGKTALLEYAIESAAGLRVARVGRGRVGDGAGVRGSSAVAWGRSQPAAGRRAGPVSCSEPAGRCSRRPTPCSTSSCRMTCPPGWPPPARAATRRRSIAAWPRDRPGISTARSPQAWPTPPTRTPTSSSCQSARRHFQQETGAHQKYGEVLPMESEVGRS